MFVVLNLMHYLFKFYDRSFESILDYKEGKSYFIYFLWFMVQSYGKQESP